MKHLFLLAGLWSATHPFAPKINDLVHTRLDVRFDYAKRYLYGKEWLTLKPHFYPTDSLFLDAQGMDIHKVAIRGKPLAYRYDGKVIHIRLDRTHINKYTIYIEYTAKPNELSFADTSMAKYEKGLFFINPDSSEKAQIYTQGEPECASAWFPTIDHPDQKSTDEIRMTVPAKYTTLSNGRLASQKRNGDGTRTDTWIMDLPQSPYLFMMAVGRFEIYHDHWRNKPVDYYLEPKYAPYAKQIFGETPAMIEFFSQKLHYDFPWNKYDQIVVRDYASGGMENTTATLLNEYENRTPAELMDAGYDKGRTTIVHELFHQWFGVLVTCVDWSDQALDETFAQFGDGLWAEHRYGKDEADALLEHDLRGYLHTPGADTLPLVRYHYDDPLDVFNVVTYFKGHCILNMLRNYLGDSAFFNGLSLYLKTNAFKNAQVTQLRLAMEAVTGRDLNWFFNQWYFGSGHPILNVRHTWDGQTETVYLEQTQNGAAFLLPMSIDLYEGGKKTGYAHWMRSKTDTITIHAIQKPDLVDVDGDKVLVADIHDDKTPEELAFQYDHAPLYRNRLEAIEHGDRNILEKALHDPYYALRITAIQHTTDTSAIADLAKTDPNTLVRAAAIQVLAKNSAYEPLFREALTSPSPAIQRAARIALEATSSTIKPNVGGAVL